MTDCLSQTIRYLATFLGVKIGCLAAAVLSPRRLFALSDRLAGLGFFLFRSFRRRSLANIRSALGDQLEGKAEEKVRQSLQNFFRACIEIFIALQTPPGERLRDIPVLGQHHLDTALAKGKGAVVLSAHLGNFFLLGRCLEKKGYICHTLLNQPRHGRFNALMNHYLDQLGQRSIAARPRNDALRKLLEVLRRNETVVMIADEFRQGTGTPVPFFGRTVIARRGPATLAARTGAPIIPACLVRQSDGSLRLIIEPELELVKSDKSKPAIKENTLRLTQWLEKTVRRHPEQWNWMTVHWQDDSHQANPSKQHRFQSTTH